MRAIARDEVRVGADAPAGERCRGALRTNRLRGVSFRYRAMLRVIERRATLDAVGSSTRHTAGTQTRAPCPGTQLGIDAISEELYHHVKFLLTPYRLD